MLTAGTTAPSRRGGASAPWSRAAVADGVREGKPVHGHAPPHGTRHPPLDDPGTASVPHPATKSSDWPRAQDDPARPPTLRVMRGSQSRGAAAAIRTIVLTVLLAGVAGGAHAEPVVAVGSEHFGNVFQEGEPADLTIRVTADPDHDLTGRVHVAAHDAYRVSAGRLTFRVHLRAGDGA